MVSFTIRSKTSLSYQEIQTMFDDSHVKSNLETFCKNYYGIAKEIEILQNNSMSSVDDVHSLVQAIQFATSWKLLKIVTVSACYLIYLFSFPRPHRLCLLMKITNINDAST